MYLRLVAGAVAWIAVLVLFAAGLQQSASPRPSPPASSSALARTLNQPQADRGQRWWSWRVTRATAAHRVMIVEVEAERVGDASAIAAQVIGPVQRDGYEEILVYVRRPGRSGPERRIRWTPGRGYAELVMAP